MNADSLTAQSNTLRDTIRGPIMQADSRATLSYILHRKPLLRTQKKTSEIDSQMPKEVSSFTLRQ